MVVKVFISKCSVLLRIDILCHFYIIMYVFICVYGQLPIKNIFNNLYLEQIWTDVLIERTLVYRFQCDFLAAPCLRSAIFVLCGFPDIKYGSARGILLPTKSAAVHLCHQYGIKLMIWCARKQYYFSLLAFSQLKSLYI